MVAGSAHVAQVLKPGGVQIKFIGEDFAVFECEQPGRVKLLAHKPEFEVQVWAGAAPGVASHANHLARMHLLATDHAGATQVPVQSF